MGKDQIIIDLKDVSFSYPEGPQVLEGLSFCFHRGSRLGLMGPNGSGKTTLFHLIMGLVKPDSGKLEIFGSMVREEKDFRSVRRRIGLLFQDPDDQLFHPTVLEDVAFGPLNMGKSKKEAREIAVKTLALLGLEGFDDRITYRLSGGEKRLVSLATVLAMQPEVLLLDEPTLGLDEFTKKTFMEVIGKLDLSFILISHEIEFLSEITDAIYAMKDGRITLDETVHLHYHLHGHPHGAYPHEHG